MSGPEPTDGATAVRWSPQIESRTLGASPLRLPRVALGCGNFGGVGSAPELFGQGLGLEQALELMDAAWKLGITHFDTADAYGGGRSEEAIGRWIATRRERPTITTKTYNPMAAGADRGLAAERVARQLDASLERLGVERVELYLAHEFDPDVALEETFGAFENLAGAGRLLAWGVSNFDRAQLEAALAAGHPQAVQNERNLLQRQDDQLLELCAERAVSYLAFGPLAGGWLTGKYKREQPFPPGSRMTQRPEPYERLVNPATFDTLDRLSAFAAQRGQSLAGLALAWLFDDERVGQVVVGPNRPEHLEPLREALANPLAPGERARLERLL
jgi:aryl-alcohol dehydrogenase-like predicted oxidoreductase